MIYGNIRVYAPKALANEVFYDPLELWGNQLYFVKRDGLGYPLWRLSRLKWIEKVRK